MRALTVKASRRFAGAAPTRLVGTPAESVDRPAITSAFRDHQTAPFHKVHVEAPLPQEPDRPVMFRLGH